ncbi:hypothetical protein ACN28S_56800 [Cystobacter fuscus]
MARISQDQTQERRAFLLELFRSQPDISRNEAMETYKDRFGASLNAKTFNELREQALSETEARASSPEESQPDADDTDADAPAEEPTAAPLRVVPTVESTAAGTPPAAKKPKPGKGPGAKNVFVDATQEQLQFLERVVHQLQEAGASNIRIDHGTERWMVLTVEAK